jgi:hypothetical protein
MFQSVSWSAGLTISIAWYGADVGAPLARVGERAAV